MAPRELDAIEDALERLDDDLAPPALPEVADLETRAEIQQRLAAYRSISRLSRAWLSTAEPPAHVLASAIAEASRPPVPVAEPRAPSEVDPLGWRARLRRWWAPGAAAAAVASAILTVGLTANRGANDSGSAEVAARARPDATPEAVPPSSAARLEPSAIAMSEPVATDDRVDRGAAAVPLRRVTAETREREESGGAAPLGGGKVAQSPGAAAPSGALSKDDAVKRPEPKADKKGTASTTPATQGPNARPTAPLPATDVSSGEDELAASERLARADRARANGDCVVARRDYEQLRKLADRKLRARALVGLSACAERDGDMTAARALLEEARVADPDAFR